MTQFVEGLCEESAWHESETVLLSNATSLIPRHAIVVYVASFKFGFGNLEQLKACIEYYSHKTHSTSRIPAKDLGRRDFGEGLENCVAGISRAGSSGCQCTPSGKTKSRKKVLKTTGTHWNWLKRSQSPPGEFGAQILRSTQCPDQALSPLEKPSKGTIKLELEHHAQPGSHAHQEPCSRPANPPAHPRLRLHRAFPSQILPDKRDVIVYLPPGYEEHPAPQLPLFFICRMAKTSTTRTHFLHFPAAPGKSANALTPPSSQAKWSRSSSSASTTQATGAWLSTRPSETGAWAAARQTRYGQLLTRELLPWIADRYRVSEPTASPPASGDRRSAAWSPLYLGLRYATWFGKLAVLSPSVWWNHKSILGYVNERAPEIWDRPKLWLDVGDHEGRRTLQDVEQLNRRLKANHWRPGETLHFGKDPRWHARRSQLVPPRPALMLKFLFPARSPS